MSITTSAPTDTAATPGGADDPASKKGGKKGGKKKLLIVLVLVLVLGGAGYWFVLKPGGGEPAEPVAGAVVVLEPVQVNLAAGHYLRVGVALQMVEGAGTEADGSQALDATIELFTGRKVADLGRSEVRNDLRAELLKTLERDYEGEVMDIYFTEFVTQ